ncbi:MAG: hypothetical protein MJY50_00180 [Bacteroidales bacterium]|nr:hypothetical protein [Bacteroidales bacterium]
MKNFILPVLAAMLLCSCGSIRLAMDTRTAEGDRILLTSGSHLFGDVDIALGAKIKSDRDTVLAVLVTYGGRSDHGVFETGDKMMIRLSDQSVISLSNIYDREYEKNTETYTTEDRVSRFGYAYTYSPFTGDVYITPYEASAFVPRVHTATTTNSYALYLITKQELLDIIVKGAVKLRVETENDELDMTLGTERVAEIMSGQYACLKDGFVNEHQRREF